MYGFNYKKITQFANISHHFPSFAVIKIQKQVETYDGNVEYIDVNHPVEYQYFTQNSKEVTQDDNHHKRRTFAFYHLCTQTFHNGYRPPDCKTQQHQHFAYFTKIVHLYRF